MADQPVGSRVVDGHIALLQAGVGGLDREDVGVLLAVEALLLRERDEHAVHDERRGRVVAGGVQAEDLHAERPIRALRTSSW